LHNTPETSPLISWTGDLLDLFKKRCVSKWEENALRIASYRPFFKQWQYFSRFWNNSVYSIPKLFPTGEAGENLVICYSGGFSLITDLTPDLHFVGDAQCFPLYWYEEKDADLFGNKTLVRHDGISDFILKEARNRYRTATISKKDIFYYVYGFLHQADYRTTFAADLKKTLPRLPLVERLEEFKTFSDAGRQLATLHLNYETLEPYPLTEVGDFFDKRIEKMSFPKKDKTRVLVNSTLMLEGIPLEAHDYVVNGRSPIEWVLDRYQVKTDKVSGITNDPNLWAPENPRYIPDLIKRLVTLSLESLRIIKTLPKITF
jgi:predicted helicase